MNILLITGAVLAIIAAFIVAFGLCRVAAEADAQDEFDWDSYRADCRRRLGLDQ